LWKSLSAPRWPSIPFLDAYRPYIIGMQLKDSMKEAGEGGDGGGAGAQSPRSLLKAKVPSSQRKIKVKNTVTYILTDMASKAGALVQSV